MMFLSLAKAVSELPPRRPSARRAVIQQRSVPSVSGAIVRLVSRMFPIALRFLLQLIQADTDLTPAIAPLRSARTYFQVSRFHESLNQGRIGVGRFRPEEPHGLRITMRTVDLGRKTIHCRNRQHHNTKLELRHSFDSTPLRTRPHQLNLYFRKASMVVGSTGGLRPRGTLCVPLKIQNRTEKRIRFAAL